MSMKCQIRDRTLWDGIRFVVCISIFGLILFEDLGQEALALGLQDYNRSENRLNWCGCTKKLYRRKKHPVRVCQRIVNGSILKARIAQNRVGHWKKRYCNLVAPYSTPTPSIPSNEKCLTLDPTSKAFTALEPIALTLVDDDAIGYATFQSHNHKVLENADGIFLTYTKSSNENFSEQHFRLVKSIDRGTSFSTVYEGVTRGHVPALAKETDTSFLLVTFDNSETGHLYRFEGPSYSTPNLVATIPNGYSSKYSLQVDPTATRAYLFSARWYDTFHTIDLTSGSVSTQPLFRYIDGQPSYLGYPHMSIDSGGLLFLAWTNVAYGRYLYWDIHTMMSPDSGVSWRNGTGENLSIPVGNDNFDVTTRISSDDEFEVHSWLSSFSDYGDKLHFVYWANTMPQRQRYVRLSKITGNREIDMPRIFSARHDVDVSIDGLMANGANDSGYGPLIFCSSVSERTVLSCLESFDEGDTWVEFTEPTRTFERGPYHGIYSVGGAQQITKDGYVIGSFTHLDKYAETFFEPHSGAVYFFKVRAGNVTASLTSGSWCRGNANFALSSNRKDIQFIKFRAGREEESAWLSFEPQVTTKMDSVPRDFLLMTASGLVAGPYALSFH